MNVLLALAYVSHYCLSQLVPKVENWNNSVKSEIPTFDDLLQPAGNLFYGFKRRLQTVTALVSESNFGHQKRANSILTLQ